LTYAPTILAEKPEGRCRHKWQ